MTLEEEATLYHNAFTPHQAKWLNILETTDLLQVQGVLRQFREGSFRYCCLGLAAEFVLEEEMLHGSETCGVFRSSFDGDDSRLLSFEKLHLYSKVGSVKDNHAYCGLAAMNDTGHSFKEIAKVIKAAPWHYFTNFDDTYQPLP